MKSFILAVVCLLSLSAVAEAHGPFVRSRVVVARPVRAAVVVQPVAVQAFVAQPNVTVINNRSGLFGRRSQQIIVQ